jgi:hypothetical protein
MALLNWFARLLPYFIVTHILDDIAPRFAYLQFSGAEILVNVYQINENEWIVKRRE